MPAALLPPGQVPNDVGSERPGREVFLGNEATPDDLARVHTHERSLDGVPLEDGRAILLVLERDRELERRNEFVFGRVEADLLAQLAARARAGRLTTIDLAARDRLAGTVRVADQQQGPLVPDRHKRAVHVGSPDEPPDAQDPVGDPITHTRQEIQHEVRCTRSRRALLHVDALDLGLAEMIGRFAPSTTGPAHPGTLLAGLLCWLDARTRGARVLLRLEDLDPNRSQEAFAATIRQDLDWLGLHFDDTQLQSRAREHHEQALDHLAEIGALYPCSCSRADLRQQGQPAPDGGFAYPNSCRARALPAGGWRHCNEPLRARLPEGTIEPLDEGGEPLAQVPSKDMGDPVVRRRDGAIAYHLASVVDDASAGVDRVVRGRDLAASTATQVALLRLLDQPAPVYRHHLLLLEERPSEPERKLSKFHAAVSTAALRRTYRADALCGVLAYACALRPDATPVTPDQLLRDFDWDRVARTDQVLRWTGERLEVPRAEHSSGQDISYSSNDASPGTPTRSGKP